MSYASTLVALENLKSLVDRYVSPGDSGSDEKKELYQDICEAFGQVQDVYETTVGMKNIAVPPGSPGASIYPTYFQAGFFSGRTFHRHQGLSELMMVIGKVRALSKTEQALPTKVSRGDGVFLVHGHDEAVLSTCARFIEKLGLTVTILREQPNKGRTIMGKFLDHAEVGFAVVLLTADDRGGKKSDQYEVQKLRARQNVIFELGFFIGALGTERVCALYEEGVEIPSDYQGVAFVPLDSKQAWRFELAKEMKAAGLPVDLNKAM